MNKDNNQELPLGLYWKDKRTIVDRIILPFQNLEVIETVNESRATREKEKGGMFRQDPNAIDIHWRNKLIWGDNKYVMSAMLEQFAGKIDLIYIDPPFATGANFDTTVEIGDSKIEHTKEASVIEELAYRDTWGKGIDSFLQMLYDRLILMRELLSEEGSIFVHLDWHTGHYAKILLDEIFGRDNFINEITWCYFGPGSPNMKQFNRKHDNIFWYSKKGKWVFNDRDIRISHNEKTLGNFKKGLEGSGFVADTYDLHEKGKIPEDWWEMAIAGRYPIDGLVRVGYPTEKPWPLIERIIKAASNENSIVADFFGGSGIVAAVAEKLGRRWVVSDLGRFAIHTTRKRMLEIDGCKPFEILNIGKYERQYWQNTHFGRKASEQSLAEYIEFILDLFKGDSMPGSVYIHGKKGAKLIHVGGVDAPVTLGDIQHALEETRRMKQKDLVILGWEWEMGLHDVVEQEAAKADIKLSLLNIPREAMDKRAVDAGDVQFFELAYLETQVKKNSHGYQINLTDFVIPNLDLIPIEIKKLVKKWSDYIDYWSVDWSYSNDTFHNQWQSYRTKKKRTLELITDPHSYEKKGDYKVMVKVIDIFGNDTTHIIDLQYR